MNKLTPVLLTTAAAFAASGTVRAQYAEGFDGRGLADISIQAQTDTILTFVDYSNMTIGSTSFSIPEAPRRVPGSAATSGIVLQANVTSGVASAINVFAGSNPIQFSGRYRLSYDVWVNVPTNPFPGGSTEQLLWGVGLDGTPPVEARNTRNSGTNGVWGWLAGENGYGTEDAAIFEDGTELADLGDTQPGEGAPFNLAFSNLLAGPNAAPANQWVAVDVDVLPSGVRVYFNGSLFFDQPGLTPSGFAMLGYEDPFGSVGSSPDGQWGLFDNFRVSVPPRCGTFGSAATQGTATGGQILNGSADPAVGCPITVRLTGGPMSSAALLAIGEPAATTIPLNLGSCTLGVEVGNIVLATLTITSAADGSGQHSIDVPNSPTFCGQAYGFQYFWLDNTACGVAHTEGLVLTLGG